MKPGNSRGYDTVLAKACCSIEADLLQPGLIELNLLGSI
jgi:hypothetical protein